MRRYCDTWPHCACAVKWLGFQDSLPLLTDPEEIEASRTVLYSMLHCISVCCRDRRFSRRAEQQLGTGVFEPPRNFGRY